MCTGSELALIAAAVGAGSAIHQGNQQKKLANFQAEQANANANAEREAGEIRAEQARERAMRVAASARASLAASGVNIDSITGNLINKDIIKRGEKDAFTETLNAEDRATALRQQADVFRLRGRQAQQAGYIRAANSAIKSGSQWHGSPNA